MRFVSKLFSHYYTINLSVELSMNLVSVMFLKIFLVLPLLGLISIKSVHADEYECSTYNTDNVRYFKMSVRNDVLIIDGKYRHYLQDSEYPGEVEIYSNGKYKYSLCYCELPYEVPVRIETRWGSVEHAICTHIRGG